MRPTVVIPAHNEAKTISKVVKEAKKYAKVIVVDDGSVDKTFKQAKKAGAVVLRHIINLGKGAALKTGFDYAVARGAKKIVMLDSDCQHDPHDIPRFVGKLDRYDIVFGYRDNRENMPLVIRIGNWGLTQITRILFKIRLNDTQIGYRAMTADAYGKIRWKSTGFDADNEMIANTGEKRLKYTEIPIKTIYLDRYKGTTVIDGLKIGLKMALIKVKW